MSSMASLTDSLMSSVQNLSVNGDSDDELEEMDEEARLELERPRSSAAVYSEGALKSPKSTSGMKLFGEKETGMTDGRIDTTNFASKAGTETKIVNQKSTRTF